MFKKKTSKILIATLLSSSLLPMLSASPISASTQAEQTPIVFDTHGEVPALSPDGKTVFVGKGRPDVNSDTDYILDMYDVQTGSLLKEIKSNNSSDYYKFSPNGKYLVSSGSYVNFLDGKTGDQLFTKDFYFPNIAFKPTDDDIAGFAYSTTPYEYMDANTFDIYDLKSDKLLYEKTYANDQRVQIAFSPTEPIVAVSHGLDIDIINYETQQTVKTIQNPFGVPADRDYEAISSMLYSPDGNTLSAISHYPAEKPFMQFDAYGNTKTHAIQIDPYINEPAKNFDALPRYMTYSPDKSEIFLHYWDKIKKFNAQTGEYQGDIGGDIVDVVFSSDMKKIAYTKNGFYHDADYPSYVEVQDFPLAKKQGSRIEFKDPYIQLRQGKSTYYGLDYIDSTNHETLLDPNDVTLDSLDKNIVEIDSSNRIMAKNPGSTMIKATYNGLVAYLNVEVQSLATSKIVVDTLYDSSMKITGTAPPNITVYTNVSNKEYRSITGSDGSFTVNIDKPLVADTTVNFMYYYSDADPAEGSSGAEHLFENVLRDTVAPVAPVISNVDQNTGVIEGKTEPYATVTVSVENSQPGTSASIASIASTATKSIKTGSTGAFKLQMATALSGTTLKSTAKDLVGNTSKPTITKVADKTPPAAPSVQPVSSIATTVSGKTESYAAVYIKKGSAILAKGTAGSSGSFSIKIPVQASGTRLSISAQDAAKNTSKSTSITVVKAPATPTASSISDKTTTVTGKALAHTTVYIKKGTTVLGSSTIASNGSYTIHIAKQPAGTVLSIVTKTSSGVYSAEKKVTVKDLTPPSAPTVNAVYSTSTAITGKTEPYAKIKVYRNSTLLGTASASKLGTWKLAIAKQKHGTSLKVYAYDKASNRSSAKTITVK